MATELYTQVRYEFIRRGESGIYVTEPDLPEGVRHGIGFVPIYETEYRARVVFNRDLTALELALCAKHKAVPVKDTPPTFTAAMRNKAKADADALTATET